MLRTVPPVLRSLPRNRYDFVAMWDFVKLTPEKLLAISKTLNGASFGFGLSKLLVSAGTAGVFAVLQLFPDHWGLIGGRNVPLGGSAKTHTDPGAFLSFVNSLDDEMISRFNRAFGPVIKECEDGQYVFSVKEYEATNRDLFRFDLNILARVFGEKLQGLNLDECENMQGRPSDGMDELQWHGCCLKATLAMYLRCFSCMVLVSNDALLPFITR